MGAALCPAAAALTVIPAQVLLGPRDRDAAAVERVLEEQLYPLGPLHPHHDNALKLQCLLALDLYGVQPGYTLPGKCTSSYQDVVAPAERGMERLSVPVCSGLLNHFKESAAFYDEGF